MLRRLLDVVVGRDHICPWWLCATFDNPARQLLHSPEQLLAPYVSPGATVADVGCGMGYFSVPLARLVGAKGRVMAVDVQPPMLEALVRRAQRAGVASQITTVQCASDDLRLDAPIDFALCFWMVHEVPDAGRLLGQLHAALKPGGLLLLVEPWLHVPQQRFAAERKLAHGAGFTDVEAPRVAISRAALLRA